MKIEPRFLFGVLTVTKHLPFQLHILPKLVVSNVSNYVIVIFVEMSLFTPVLIDKMYIKIYIIIMLNVLLVGHASQA